jgi:hypothetical protein
MREMLDLNRSLVLGASKAIAGFVGALLWRKAGGLRLGLHALFQNAAGRLADLNYR